MKLAVAFLFIAFLDSAVAIKTLDEWEEELLSLPDPKKLRSNLFDLTRHSHVAGTKGDYYDAHYVFQKFQNYGLKVELEKVPVMLAYPLKKARLYTSDGNYEAKLSEDVLPQDETSDTPWRNHTFLAYSPAGTVTAKLVYANYGRPQDFDQLERMGVDVKGAIVIMRYGECFRGLKIMNAEARGAIGSIIYTDPQDDGYVQGPTYPTGPWRPPSSVQRGSVQFISRCAGDPWRLYLNDTTSSVSKVCGYNTSDLVPSHPALPISYQDAQPLLASLGGPKARDSFQGGLNITYTVGPSSYEVTLSTYNHLVPSKIPNVIATIPGSDPKAGRIILGNHRDAWVFGAVDPNSGTAVLIELARVFSQLLQHGWKPKRTIILASWSGEEYGLLGSTAFAELKESDIIKSAIAYLNVDEAVTGHVGLKVACTHSLERLFVEATQRIPAPYQYDKTLFDKWDKTMGTLGSGSDYTVFLDRFGVASMDMSYSGDYGVYHSVYDSFDWMQTQGDPDFECHRAMTRLWSLMAFRLSSYNVLPFYMKSQAEQMTRDVAMLAIPASKAGIDLTSLLASVEMFRDAALSADLEKQLFVTQDSFEGLVLRETRERNVEDLNRRLAYTERKFIGPGLPNRPWFRHILQAPGYYLGYGSQAFPGIAEAIADANIEIAKSEAAIAAAAVEKAASFLSGNESSVLSSTEGSSEEADYKY